MKRLARLAIAAAIIFVCGSSSAQTRSYDVFMPISKYIAGGDYEALSAWFADNLDIQILSRESNVGKAQARQIVKSFFEDYTPRSFEINHTAGRANKKYAIGQRSAGGDKFLVTIFVNSRGEGNFLIEQLKIERQNN